MHQADVIVLGAGIVGVSTAMHLRLRGLDVILVDRRYPGEETSFGNAGVVERNGFAPHPFPTNPALLTQILFGQSSAVSIDLKTVLGMIPWLTAYKRCGSQKHVQDYAHVMGAMRERVVEEHARLAELSNAQRFYRRSGWLHLMKAGPGFSAGDTERHFARVFGVDYQELDEDGIAELERDLRAPGYKGIFWPQTASVSSPGAVTESIWRGFVKEGGKFISADAFKIQRLRGQWILPTDRGEVTSSHAVVALGPWSADFCRKFGENFPLAVKRGHHLHFRPRSGASLSRPVVDLTNGFAITPMEKGIRLTTGVDFSHRDAPPNKRQVALAERRARDLFPLGEVVDSEPWCGSRPCLPDSLPVLGKSTKVANLWFNFGHGHCGFTLGPLHGRLMAEMLLGQKTAVDVGALNPYRFDV